MTKDEQPTVEELILDHLPLVGYHVTEMLHRVPPTVSRDELASAGNLALVLAAKAYDPTTGVPFARYAALRISGALLDELRSMDWATRGARRRARELGNAADSLRATLGRTPTREELAESMGTDTATVDAARMDAERRVLSIDATDHPVSETIRDEDVTPEESLLANERIHWLRSAVTCLPDRLRTVVEGLFLEERSVAELASELGVTQSRISQMRTEALGLLRDGMNNSLDPDLVPTPAREGVAERRRRDYFAAVAARASSQPMLDRIPTQRTAPAARPVEARDLDRASA
ncbi:MAG: sigma-70 family RNA polymerase sigma factor [Micrococcales bacterium]|nr:sigma-70 family RNA polymerase sigma factor [Micrococcales bacterium]